MSAKPISNSLSYLIAQTCKSHRAAADKLLAQIGLHAGQEMILCRLWQQNGLTQTELADQLCVQAATVTKMVHRMVKAGLVERRRDPEDQRVSRVYLTERGQKLQKPVQEVWERLERSALGSLEAEEQRKLRHLLGQVHANLNE